MSVRVEVVCVNPDGSEQRREVLRVEARELAMETLGLNLSEGKALLAGVQGLVVAQQVSEHLEQRRACPHCHGHYTSKDSGATVISTVFDRVEVPNPRWNRCPCQTDGPKTFRPMRIWLNGQTSPEMLYLETKVGIVDPVRQSGGFAQGGVAGRGCSQPGDHPRAPVTCMRPPSGSNRNSATSAS
jgi:hypothetical protein